MSSTKEFDSQGRQKIRCEICGNYYHRLDVHLSTKHKTNVADYNKQFPGCPTISEAAKEKAARSQAARAAGASSSTQAHQQASTQSASAEEGAYKIGVATLYKRENLTELDKVYVPKHDPNWMFDETVMEEWEYIAIGIEDNEPIYIGGPTGCGKSASCLEMAAAINQPVLRVQLTRDFRVSQFVGSMELKLDDNGNRYTEFTDGVLPQAMKNGWWLLLDEVDMAHADVTMALQSVLEGNPLVLTENFGEVVKPHENFRIIATANTMGNGDETGLYEAAKAQNQATLDRYGVTIKADYPNPETEADILVTRSGISKADAKKMVKVARTVRESLQAEECRCTFSTRRLISWAKKAVRLSDVRKGAKIAVLNKLETDDAEFVNSLIQRYFGGQI